jgi:glucokinase
MGHWVVGIDLGGTKTALGLIDPDDRIIARLRMPTNAKDGPQAVVDRIATGVAKLGAGKTLSAVSICSPGPVDHVTGTLIDPPNLPSLHHMPLREMLSDRLHLPVIVESDSKAAALGEFHYGAGRGEHSMVYIVVGTGVGAAIIADGQLYRGERNSAGEVGHITLDPSGEVCSCGSRGCVETHISGPWLERRYRRLAEQELGPAVLDGQRISGELVALRARQGDGLAAEIMVQAGEALGVAVATMAMILDIGLYVVGGGVAKAGDLLLEPARAMVPRCSYRSVSDRVCIVASQLGEDGPILGCCWLAKRMVCA